jgi:hypothetical protein
MDVNTTYDAHHCMVELYREGCSIVHAFGMTGTPLEELGKYVDGWKSVVAISAFTSIHSRPTDSGRNQYYQKQSNTCEGSRL